MGDMADYCRDQEWWMREGAYDPEPITRDSVWITKEKRHIPIREMDDHHLLNTIRVLRGKSPIGTRLVIDAVHRCEWLNAMANEAYSRGLSVEEVDEKDPVHE
jgi:hypothetical protein